ncbi:dysbindin isoform X1 [Electrophorus electricus]|uniref:dysbindin isoform X1 n=2 Tax=Electrophorus electricus TaxID=8005 RepID=UPI0015CFEBF9|nr:dysbindin isoform X1 [Electrophorus electricus]
MSSTGTNMHTKRLSSETEHTLRLPDMDTSQQLKMRERQRFFEEVFQHDVDVYLSSAHLQIDYKRPPMGSISSMEVNVDMLEQMELLDISDPEALDVFLGTSSEDDAILPAIPGVGCSSDGDDALGEEIFLRVPDNSDLKSWMSSTSSCSTSDSQATNEDGARTPVNQSDDEDVHSDDDDNDDDDDDCLSVTGMATAKAVKEEQPALL